MDKGKPPPFSFDHSEPWRFGQFVFGCPTGYVVWRLVWAAYHLGYVIHSTVSVVQTTPDAQTAGRAMVYLTRWTFFALTVDTVVQAICAVHINIRRPDIMSRKHTSMEWYLRATWLCFAVSGSSSLVVSGAYWTLIFHGGGKIGFASIATHGINSVYTLVNLCVAATPVYFTHVVYPFLFGATWIFFSLVYDAAGGLSPNGDTYIYSVFDWSENPLQCALLALLFELVVGPLLHALMVGVSRLRDHYWKRCSGFDLSYYEDINSNAI